MIDLNFNPPPEPKCKNCGKGKSHHKARTFNCPFGRGSFPQFKEDLFFEPREKRKVSLTTNDTRYKI